MSQAPPSTDLEQTLNLVLDQLAAVVAHESAAILLLNDNRIEVVSARGYPALARLHASAYSLDSHPHFNRIASSPQPLVLHGHVADELFYNLACYGAGCSCINVPLRALDEQPIGYLTINRHNAPSPTGSGTGSGFTPAEGQLLTAFARQAALAIENARLYDQARRSTRQLEAAAQVGRQLTLLKDSEPHAAKALDDLLAETVRVVREKFGYDQAYILLLDTVTDELVLKEASGPAAVVLKYRGLRLKVGLEGITGWVAHSGEPLLCNDVSREPRFYTQELAPGTRSELAVPLRLGERIIGVLDMQSDRLNTFRPEDIRALQLIGDQVAIAIENARLFQETKGSLAAMRALHDISLDIVAQLDLSELLRTLLQRAARLVQAEGVALAVYDEHTGSLRNIAGDHTSRDWSGVTLRPGEGLVGTIFETGEPLIVNDYARWPNALEEYLPPEQPMMMGVPLRWHDRIIGVLVVLNRAEGHAFNLEDQRVLYAFADLASIALKNAELYAQVKSFSHTLEEQVGERTSELVEARQQVLARAEQIQHLLSRTVHIQEEERARIARDLHDSVTQLTIGAMLELRAAKADLDAAPSTSSGQAAAREKVDMARDLLKQIEREIRQAIYDLRPVLLDAAGGLLPALQRYAASFEALSGVHCDVRASGVPARLPAPVEVVIFRIVQEALHNVMTHARARHAQVALAFEPAPSTGSGLSLTIADDGQGFDVEAALADNNNRHVGLHSMRERAQVINAQLDVSSQPGRGTRVCLRLTP